jgi:hypothetical protein
MYEILVILTVLYLLGWGTSLQRTNHRLRFKNNFLRLQNAQLKLENSRLELFEHRPGDRG